MAIATGSLIGSAGVYYVAARLNAMGYHVAPTMGSVPTVDLLVSSLDGSASVCLQVKTARWAARTRGRGELKKPHHYEWDIGWGCAHLDRDDLFFALVDLKEFDELPDVFVLPSKKICAYFEGGNPTNWPRARYHPSISEIAAFVNNWDMVTRRLKGRVKAARA
jgi:hypothetical protein